MSVTSSAIQAPISKFVSKRGSGAVTADRESKLQVTVHSCQFTDRVLPDIGDLRSVTCRFSPCPVRLWDFVLPSVIVQGCHRVCQSCEGAGAPILVPLAPLGRGMKGEGARITHAMAEVAYLLRSEEHTSELQSQSNLVCRLLL